MRGKTPNPLISSRRRRKSRNRLFARINTAAFILCGFLVSGIIGAGTYFVPSLVTAVQSTGQKISLEPVPRSPGAAAVSTPDDTTPPPPGDPFTVLLLGSDNDGKAWNGVYLTQSMILVRVVPSTQQVTLFSIPRDLYVPMASGGEAKIDAAYAYGGPSDAVQTVEEDFQVHIDYYVWIGLQGLVNLINLVGGVDVVTTHPVLDDYYPADLTSSNAYDYARVSVLGGAQHLDGLHAMEYVRSRHDDLFSDLGRSQRQQQVLVALRQKSQQFSVADIPRITAAMAGQFKTDMDLTQLPSLLGLARKISPDQTAHVFLLPPLIHDGDVNGSSVLLPDWDRILPLVHQSFPAT